MSSKQSLRRVGVALMLLVALLVQGTWALAGTTGGLTGTLVDDKGTPVSGATVTVDSPSQKSTTTTDATGHFGFLSLAPDTYTISASKTGFQPISAAGTSVFADQTETVTLHTSTLKEIGNVTARSATALVKAGVTADVYSVNPAQQAAAAALSGGGNLTSAYSAISSVPGVFVQVGGSGWGQSIYIRGGDYTQTGNEIDGIPINRQFDQYSTSALSSLGSQEIQVYTGAAPVDSQAQGLAGFVNQVIRTGTYPGSATADLSIGTPFYHHADVEVGGASPNRLFSYYVGLGGYTQTFKSIDNNNGNSYATQYGTPYNFIAGGCGGPNPTVGCYGNGAGFLGLPLGPNGFVTPPFFPFGSEANNIDREVIANFHIGVPHKHDGGRDDIQLLYNTGEVYNLPNTTLGSFGGLIPNLLNGTANYNGAFYQNCADPTLPAGAACAAAPGIAGPLGPGNPYNDQGVYTGPVGTALSAANLGAVQNVYFTGSSPNRTFGSQIPLNSPDGETNGFAILKGQYQHNFGSSAYARAYAYTLYSDRIDGAPNGVNQNYYGAFSPDYSIYGHTRGYAFLAADQLNAQNLLSLDYAYTESNTTRTRNDFAAGQGPGQLTALVDSTNPLNQCYAANAAGTSATASSCAGTTQYVLGYNGKKGPAANLGYNMLVPTNANVTTANVGTITCGAGPCEFLVIGNGDRGARNTVKPKFTAVSLQDLFKPNDRLTLNLSAKAENFEYDPRNTSTPGNILFVNAYNNTHCFVPSAGTGLSPTIASRAYGAACATGSPTTLSANSYVLDFHGISPRFGATYQLNPYNVLRASYGRFVQAPETSSVQAANIQPSAPSAAFYTNFGFNSYTRVVSPEISYNTDFSWEHQIKGSDVSFSVSPFMRKTKNEFVTILVDPKTNFVANVNGENRDVKGVELAVHKGDFSRDGLAASLAYTYTYARAKYVVSPTGGSYVSGANAGIVNFNQYTSYCAKNFTALNCGALTAAPANAVPCFTPAAGGNTPDAACAAGDIANPYYNAPANSFGLFDPSGSYVPYNGSLGNATGGTSTSYIVPHVATLILQYKKQKWTVTPSLQFEGGARYGTPLAVQGVDPATCGALATGTAATDPRYNYGAPTGAGVAGVYDASSCQAIAIPNPQTKQFDAIGGFVQPNLLVGNLQLGYEMSKNISLQLTAANIYTNCWGGSSVPWKVSNKFCNYSQAGAYAANFYNPGDTIQPGYNQSYLPNFANSQGSTAGANAPLSLYFDVKFRL